jgi:hypothetical protein
VAVERAASSRIGLDDGRTQFDEHEGHDDPHQAEDDRVFDEHGATNVAPQSCESVQRARRRVSVRRVHVLDESKTGATRRTLEIVLFAGCEERRCQPSIGTARLQLRHSGFSWGTHRERAIRTPVAQPCAALDCERTSTRSEGPSKRGGLTRGFAARVQRRDIHEEGGVCFMARSVLERAARSLHAVLAHQLLHHLT